MAQYEQEQQFCPDISRREAFRVFGMGAALGLAAGCVTVAMPPIDPCLAFVTGWNDVTERCNNLLQRDFASFYETEVVPFEDVAAYGVIPSATTAEGAAAALRKALAFGDMEAQDANLIRAALAYVEGRDA